MTGVNIKAIGDANIATASNGSFHVTIPIKIRRRGRRKAVTFPDGTAFQPRTWDRHPTPIQQALARGHQWLGLLESGKTKNLSDVAELVGMERAYVSRMVNLTTLAPDIVASILDESLPNHVTLFDLASGTPLLWDEPRALLRR
jgi:hypothetical protein